MTAAEPAAARRLARFCLALRPADLPPPVWAEVELCLLDLFACCLRARGLPWSRQARARTAALGARPEATVIGTDLRTAASEAAFANAVAGHGLIREDMHVASGSHIGVVVLPALLALAEREDAGGPDLAAATVAGYEVMARLGRALMSESFARRFRPTGTTGPLAAAAAGARLLRLDEDTAVNALGLAGNLGCGLNEWPWSGGTEIYFHAGTAARGGVLAVELARLGATASESIIDGPAGMLAAYGAGPEAAERLTDGLGDTFEILQVRHKPAPACNFAQTPAQAALQLVRQGGVTPAVDVRRVRVRSFPAATSYPGCDHAGPFETLQQAKMSVQYTVASVLAQGALDEANFRRLDDPETLRLAAATELVHDPAFAAAFPAKQGAAVEVTLADGTTRSARLDDVRWLTPEEVRARFREEVGAALSPARARAIEETVAALSDLRRVADLMTLLRADGEARHAAG